MSKFGHFGPRSVCWLSNLNEISYAPFFEFTDFKFVNCFWKFRAQIPKFGHFGPKSIFLILTEFPMYPISKVLISNFILVFEIWAQMHKFGHFRSKSINFLILTKLCLYHTLKVVIIWLSYSKILEFYNFFDQDKLFHILVLST